MPALAVMARVMVRCACACVLCLDLWAAACDESWRCMNGCGFAGAVEATHTVLSLWDSVSWRPIHVPARGDCCQHLQCFDLHSFLVAHSRSSLKRWQCSVCAMVGHVHTHTFSAPVWL